MAMDASWRFWSKADRSGGPEACWPWQGAMHPDGYGSAWDPEEKRTRGAHRIAYEVLVGPIPDGYDLDHLCVNPPCINPAHLRPVTRAENMARVHLFDVGAVQRAVTHCPAGHPYDEPNTYRFRGRRACRACNRTRRREAYRARVGVTPDRYRPLRAGLAYGT